MAFGATRATIVRLIVRQGMTLALVGIGVGLLVAVGLSRLIRSLLYSVSATDPIAYTVVPAFLALVALLATALPAGRAARVDPARTLREE